MKHRWAIIGATIVVALLLATGAVFLAMERRSAELASREVAALEELAMVAELPVDAAASDTTTVTEGRLPAPSDAAAASRDDSTAPGTVTPATTATTVPTSVSPAPVGTGVFEAGELVFVSRIPGDDYGTLGAMGADGTRRSYDLECARAYAAAGVLLCLESAGMFVPAGTATVRSVSDETFPEIWQRPSGLPSRARVTPDGSRLAFTGFVAGHSYLQIGEFSTETIVGTPTTRGIRAEHLEVTSDEPRFRAIDGNWWGVSFEPGATSALLTYGTGPSIEIMRADLTTATVAPLGIEGGCPSVSPSGRYVVVKRPDPRIDAPLALILHDLETGEEQLLNEARFVDDQVEWLDDDTILYALPRDNELIQPVFDIWALDIGADATATMVVPYADSPAVYRDSR
jgi:hypothetical protein